MEGSILLLEDDAALRESLAEILEEQGYRVCPAGAGAEAVRLAHEQSFDLIVTDIRMEGMSGLDALEQVKQDRPDIGSMVITGYSTEADSIRALQLGVGNYLKKPFSMPDFLQAVEAEMARRREEQKLVQRERSLRQAALWALEMVARSLDVSAGPTPFGGLVEAARKGAHTASRLGLGAARAEETQVGFLMAALKRSQDVSVPEFLTAGLPESVQRLATEVDLRFDEKGEQIPMPARIAGYLLARVHEKHLEDLGRFDPRVVEAVEKPEALEEESIAQALEQARRRRSLLALGRALAQQDPESARASFHSVLSQESRPTREGVEAQLALARLGTREDAARHACEAAQKARSLSPLARGLCQLEAALLLLQLDHPEGRNWLGEAEGVLQELGPNPGAARARLARQRLSGPALLPLLQEDLRLLLLPENLDNLYPSAGWLFPWLAELPQAVDDPLVGRAMLALARNCPEACAPALARPRSRENALEALARSGTPAARQILEKHGVTPQEVPEALPVLRIYSLGPFTVFLGDRRIEDWHSQKVRYLLACLAASPGRPVSEDVLVDAFWPEDPIRGKNNLYTTTSNLRRSLRPSGFKGDAIPRTPAGLSLNPEMPRWHDLEELEKALKEGGVDAWIRAARLYQGAYLEGCYYEWALVTRNRLEVKMQEVLMGLVQQLSGRERWPEVLEYSQQLLELEPCSQEGHLAIMKAHVAMGHPEHALRQFETCKTTLRKELQLEPSPALVELTRTIR